MLRLILLLILASPLAAEPLVVGTLQSDVARVGQLKVVGVGLATVEVSWDRFEPQDNQIDEPYIANLQAKLDAFRKAGQNVQIDLGLQYPPKWVQDLPDSRYVNQYGDAYINEQPGANVVNAVFNAAIRRHQADYVAKVFAKLGKDFYAVRLGWNYYGELGYPAAKFKDRDNCYWGFDRNAQGQAKGLPKGIEPCPAPGWKPGMSSKNAEAATVFANWYLNALVSYQQFQIATVRRHYPGRVVILLGSWGLRPGVLAGEIEGHLGNPKQTEISLGYDFARIVGAIDDEKVAVCTTWVDANFGNDDDDDAGRWSPAHYLSTMLKARQSPLELWAENTGRADLAAMKRSFDRCRAYGVTTLVWAFEPDLFDGQHATLADLRALMDEPKAKGHNSKP